MLHSVFDIIETPVGKLAILCSDEGVYEIIWENKLIEKATQKRFAKLKQHPRHPHILETKKQLKEYFNNKRKTFDLPLKALGTEFQKKVWKELSKIPYGKTISYGEQAKRLGDAKKARAVGTANGRNPLSIIIPCHRVISGSGSLGGFGGGIENKKFLLALEGYPG